MNNYRIGVDVGGTNTDAVLMKADEVLAAQKMPTTQDVSSGIIDAIGAILKTADVRPSEIACVMIGTTHFTNAFIEKKGLLPVGVIRIARPAARGIAPLSGWPSEFKDVIGNSVHEIHGGYNFDGTENSPLNADELLEAITAIKAAGIKTFAISGLFSSVNNAMELRAETIIRDALPDAAITLSHRIGKMGMLERENASIMNASLADLAQNVIRSFEDALQQLEITAPFYISQNDGTLMSAERVKNYPVLTFASGPTNSMRGASYLSGISNAIVADIGGTTTDIGVLVNGFPRESSLSVDIGGVKTNFRMPDIIAVGLGGGSLVDLNTQAIGPQSVGYKLLEEAHVFGGETLTASDIAVAAGYAKIGDAKHVADLPAELVSAAAKKIHTLLSDNVDKMKTSSEPVPLILVGGGSVLISKELDGISEVLVPKHADVANAVGASIAQVAGEIDKVVSYEGKDRKDVIDAAIEEAKVIAIDLGAIASSLEITEIEELPIPYMPGESVCLRVKVAGDLNLENIK